MPTNHAPNRHCGRLRMSWLTAGAVSAERLRRRMAKSGRTLAGQKLWGNDEIEHLRRTYPDYRKARAVLPDRSLSAIRSKASRLRITRSRRIWSDNDVKRLKAPYRQGRPVYEILALFPGKTKQQIWTRGRRSGWRRPRTPPKAYELKHYDDVRAQAFASKLSMRELACLSVTGSYFLQPPSRNNWRKISKAVEMLDGKLSVVWSDK
jgi:hypothetical protein